MNKFIIIILAFFAINGFFSLISFLFPSVPIMDKIIIIYSIMDKCYYN